MVPCSTRDRQGWGMVISCKMAAKLLKKRTKAELEQAPVQDFKRHLRYGESVVLCVGYEQQFALEAHHQPAKMQLVSKQSWGQVLEPGLGTPVHRAGGCHRGGGP